MNFDALIPIVEKYTYFGVFFLIAVETVFPPIPSEVILTFGGFMAKQTDMTLLGVIIAATIGSTAGAMALYVLGMIFNAERLERFTKTKAGKVIRLEPGDVSRAGRWFVKYGGKAVFFGRFIPIIRSVISFPAGAARMKLIKFLPLTILGSAIWNAALASLGWAMGEAYNRVADAVDVYALIALAVLAIACALAAAWYIKKRFFSDEKPSE